MFPHFIFVRTAHIIDIKSTFKHILYIIWICWKITEKCLSPPFSWFTVLFCPAWFLLTKSLTSSISLFIPLLIVFFSFILISKYLIRLADCLKISSVFLPSGFLSGWYFIASFLILPLSLLHQHLLKHLVFYNNFPNKTPLLSIF